MSIGLAGLAGLALQQLSVLVINWSAQQSGDQGALTRFTWANAIYLLPYAVLAAPLLQLAFPRLAAAAERGPAQVREVLAEVAPLVVAMAWLGAALLVATAVPVARVFILGPGSGRTAALAWPIAFLAPAVLGFGMLGLASRTLLARHEARGCGHRHGSRMGDRHRQRAGAAHPGARGLLVSALAASVSLGMLAGALVGWLLLTRSIGGGLGLARPMLAGAGAAALAGTVGALIGQGFGSAGLLVAALGAVLAALVGTAAYAAGLRLLAPDLLRSIWALRRPLRGGVN